MAAANSSSRAMQPVRPSCTSERGPPSGVTTTGTPEAIASSTTLPNVSVCDGKTNTSIPAYARARASPRRTPVNSARGRRSRSQRFFGSLSDDAEAKVADPAILQFLLNASQQRHVLLHAQASHKSQDEVRNPTLRAAALRRKQLGIDAALHQVTGAACLPLQQAAKVRIRRKENPGPLVQDGGDVQRRPFNAAGARRRLPAGRCSNSQCDRVAAYSCRFVCHEAASGIRKPQASSAPTTPISLGPGDVDDIRTKRTQSSRHRGNMADPCRIELQVSIERNRQQAARQLQRGQSAFGFEGTAADSRRAHTGRAGSRRRAKSTKWREVCATPLTS